VPRSGRACRLENKLPDGSLGTRPTGHRNEGAAERWLQRRGGKAQRGRRSARRNAGPPASRNSAAHASRRPRGFGRPSAGEEAPGSRCRGRRGESPRGSKARRVSAAERASPLADGTDSRREQTSEADRARVAFTGARGSRNGKRGTDLERGPALREAKTLKVESQERYRDEIGPERSREAKAGESVRNAGAGPWWARKAHVKRIPDSVSAVGSKKPRKVVGPRRALPLPGVKSQRVTGSENRAQLAASAVGEGAPVDGWFRVARPGGAREAPRGAARRARDGPAKAAVRRT